jgi:hypothetical protein
MMGSAARDLCRWQEGFPTVHLEHAMQLHCLSIPNEHHRPAQGQQ